MVRIGVNIPSELMRRLEPLKPDLNISQVCREALEAKAASHERIVARLDDSEIQGAIEMVWEQEKKFLAVIEVDWETLGYEDAESWTKAANREDWVHLHHRQDVIEKQGRPTWEVPPPNPSGVKGFTERRGELDQRMHQQEDDFFDWLYDEQGGIDYSAAEREYMTAWLSYTEAVWELIRQRELEHRNWQLAQRAAPPEPEAPEHLFGGVQFPNEQPSQIVPHHAGYAPGVEPLKLNHLIGDLDVAEFLAKRERPQ